VLLSRPERASGKAQFKRRTALVVIAALSAAAFVLASPPVTQSAPGGVVASFTYSPSLPLPGQTVVFTSTSTVTPAKNVIASEAWDLDADGQFDDAFGPITSRAFSAGGTHEDRLLVTDVHGFQDEAVGTVTVNSLPAASFVSSASPVAGALVYFFSISSDPDGFVTSQAWDLDNDGQFDDGASPLASRSFATPGRYTVRLRVVDNGGASQTTSADVTVVPSSSPVSAASGPKLLSPFPVVRISGIVTRAGIRVRLLTVDAPAGARIKIRCRSRGCPYRLRSRLIESRAGRATGPARASRLVRFRRFKGRLLRPGTVVQVFVTKPGTIGKYTRLRIRRARLPARADRCLVPGAARPVRCPTG
jgi:PKD repeat protein